MIQRHTNVTWGKIYMLQLFFFLSVKFYSSFVLGMVIMYDNEFKIKEEQNLTEENN